MGDVGERSGLDDELTDALLALGDDAALMSNPSDVVVLRREVGDVVDVDRCGEEGAATTVTARMQCGDGEPWIPRQLIGGVDADHTAPGKPEVAVVAHGLGYALGITRGHESTDVVGADVMVVGVDACHVGVFCGDAGDAPPGSEAVVAACIAQGGDARQQVGMHLVGIHHILLLEQRGDVAGEGFALRLMPLQHHAGDARMTG